MIEIRVPDLGGTVSECIVVAWLKAPGADVAAGEPVVEVTADKATLLLESPAAGTLLCAPAAPGTVVPVNGVLGAIGAAGESVPAALRAVSYQASDPERACRFHPGMEMPAGPAQAPTAMRSVVARRMVQSKREAPHWYLVNTVDMSGCIELRKRLKAEGSKATYNDMVIAAAARTLTEFPDMQSLWTSQGVVRRAGVHIGFACAPADNTLYVPVIRDADRLDLAQIAERSRDLALRAKNGRLRPADYVGGVFTVSNLGSYDAEIFIPIINPGEGSILAVGAVMDKPCAVDGAVVVRPLMNMTLSSDHRTIDGVLGAKFCRRLKALLESPAALCKGSAP